MSNNRRFDQKKIREHHYLMLLSLIQKHKKISRSQLAEITKISNTTVGKIVKSLIEDKLVIEVGKSEGEVGRRATLLEINPNGSCIIGVAIDKGTIKIALVSLKGEVFKKSILGFDVRQKPEKTFSNIASRISSMIEELNGAMEIIAVGVTLPGLVSWPEGEVLTVPQFKWNNIRVRSYLEKELGYHVYVDNHVKGVLLAENLFGNLSEINDAVCIHIGSGVGSSIMVNGKILRGYLNTLGEIGHTTLDPNGPLCDCGRLGCLQTFICASEIEKQTQRPIKEVFMAYKQKEDWAVKVIERAKNYLAIAISNVICSYNPRAILLAGPIIKDFTPLVEGIEVLSNKLVWGPIKDSYQIVYESADSENDVIGASALVLYEFLR